MEQTEGNGTLPAGGYPRPVVLAVPDLAGSGSYFMLPEPRVLIPGEDGRRHTIYGGPPPTKPIPAAPAVPGVGPDAPTATNAAGGKQSASPYRADLLPARAVLAVAAVLKHGSEKYGEDNWRKLAAREIVNHALVHLFAWLAGDRQDDHLGHAACRALMALDLELTGDAK